MCYQHRQSHLFQRYIYDYLSKLSLDFHKQDVLKLAIHYTSCPVVEYNLDLIEVFIFPLATTLQIK